MENRQTAILAAFTNHVLGLAVEIGAELAAVRGKAEWLAELRPRLQAVVKNSFAHGPSVSLDDELAFYESGLNAVEMIIAGISKRAEDEGLFGDADSG